MITHTILRAVGVSLLVSSVALAQGDPAPPGGSSTSDNTAPQSRIGAYDFFGTIEAGYRVVNINSGDQEGEWFQRNAENLFQEQYNLTDSGFAIGRQLPLRLDLFAARRPEEAGFFDQLFVNADLNPTVQGGTIRLRQFGAYDLNIGYRNVDYFYDRYDSLFHDLRRYETNRSDLNASLDVTLTDFLGVGVRYRGVGHGGSFQKPVAMFVEGGGGLASYMNVSRLYYLADVPRTDWSSDFSGALSARFDVLDVTVGGGVTSFTEDYTATGLPGADSLSLAFRDTNNVPGNFANRFGIVGDQTARERLHYWEQAENRELSGPHVFAQAVLRPADIVRLTADVRLDMLEGTTDVSTRQQAEARKSNAARAFQLYRSTVVGDVTNELDRMRASVSASVIPMPDLTITAGWRMQREEQKSHSVYNVTFDTTATLSESGAFRSSIADSVRHFDWEFNSLQPVQSFFGSVTFSPLRELTLSLGARSTMRTPEVSRTEEGTGDSVIATNLSKETSGFGFDVGASYAPMPELRLRGRFEMMQREATFVDDGFGGPSPGTVTDLEPRTAPENITRVNASVDWDIVENFGAGVRFSMRDGSADLEESMWVTDGPGGAVELVDDELSISGLLSYTLGEATTFRLHAQSRTSDFSIPVTWTRGQEVVTPLFGLDPTAPPSTGTNEYDSATVIFAQSTDELYLDFGVATRLIDALTLGAGVSYLAVQGEPATTAEVKNPAGTPTRQGDVTRVGGPFNRIIVNGNVGFDITPQLGIGVDLMYAMQEEETVIDEGVNVPRRFYGLNDYNGLSAAFSVMYNF